MPEALRRCDHHLGPSGQCRKQQVPFDLVGRTFGNSTYNTPNPTASLLSIDGARLLTMNTWNGGIERLDNVRPETVILCDLATRLLPKSPIPFARFKEHSEVRKAIAAALAAEQQTRVEQPGNAGPETFLFIHGLQRNKKLKFDEEMSFSLDASAGAHPGLQFNKLITESAGLGFHVIATCDSYNNVMRFLSRKAVSEFEMRVVFQMSSNDSASLIESPQANDLGLHRAILSNGQEGWTETFRPYALPETAWIASAGQALSLLHA